MEEIVEIIQQHAIPQSIPADLPDEDDLVEIEEEILLPIPVSYKSFLMNASNLVCGALEPVTATDPQLHTHLPEVTAEAWANGLPRDLIPLCQMGDGYYCVNQQGEVQLWQDGQLGEDTWEDVWQWALLIWVKS